MSSLAGGLHSFSPHASCLHLNTHFTRFLRFNVRYMLHLQKKAFEEEKATFLKEQFFKLSPFKDHISTPEMSRGKRRYPTVTVCCLKDVARLQLF